MPTDEPQHDAARSYRGSTWTPNHTSLCRTAALLWGVPESVIPRDTSRHVHAMMMDRFASMTINERAATAEELNDMCTTLAIAGIRSQHGDVTGDDLRWHLAARRYGKSLADDVYGPR